MSLTISFSFKNADGVDVTYTVPCVDHADGDPVVGLAAALVHTVGRVEALTRIVNAITAPVSAPPAAPESDEEQLEMQV